MSTLWKLYGLAAVSQDFNVEVGKLIEIVNALNGDAEMSLDDKMKEAAAAIDPVMLDKFRVPIGHLDLQAFRDSLLIPKFWTRLASLQAKGVFSPAPSAQNEPLLFDEYCRVIGLASTDPWIGNAAPNATGFRHELKANAQETVRKYGFALPDELADRIATGLTKQVEIDGRAATVFDVMNETSLFWEDGTFSNVTDRALYVRTKTFPKGWVKR
jgi:hypothetical protein